MPRLLIMGAAPSQDANAIALFTATRLLYSSNVSIINVLNIVIYDSIPVN